MKKQLAAAAAVLALSAGFTMSASASLYSASGNDWVDNDTARITVEEQNGNHVLHMKGNGTESNLTRRYLKLNDGNASWLFYTKINRVTDWWLNSMRVAEPGSGVYAPYKFEGAESTWTYTDLEDGWKQAHHSVWYENKNNASLVMLAGGSGDYYLDDVLVMNKNSGAIVLFDDFETEITNVRETDDGLAWENVAAYDELRIYKEKEDGTKALVKTVGSTVTSVTSAELGGSNIGTWYLKPVKKVDIFDKNGTAVNQQLEFNGEKVVVLATREVSFGAYADTTELETLQAGTVTVKASIKNNKETNPITAQFIAILKKDGRVVSVKGSSVLTAAMGDPTAAEYSESFTIPDGETGYELGMYLWDSLEGMKIVSPSKVISQASAE